MLVLLARVSVVIPQVTLRVAVGLSSHHTPKLLRYIVQLSQKDGMRHCFGLIAPHGWEFMKPNFAVWGYTPSIQPYREQKKWESADGFLACLECKNLAPPSLSAGQVGRVFLSVKS